MTTHFLSLRSLQNGRFTLIPILIIPFCLTLVAQRGLNEATISLMKGSVEPGTQILEFRPNTLLLKVKSKGIKQFTEQEIPVHAVRNISIRYGFSHGKGALNGLVLGSLTGLSIGLLAEPAISDTDFTGGYAFGGLFLGATLGSLFGFVIGGKKKKRFEINGNIENYKKNLPEMQELLIKK